MSSEGILPTIKCSTCGVDIEISSLADHVCVPVQSMSSHTKFYVSPADKTIGPQAQAHQLREFTPGRDPAIHDVPYSRQIPIIQEELNIQARIQIPQGNPGVQQPSSLFGDTASRSKAGFLRSGRNVPPRIDAAAASKSVRRVC